MKILRFFLAIVLVLFGGLSVFLTTSVLLDWFGIRQMEGNFVPFIVWANLICGFLYFFGAYALFKIQKKASLLLALALLILIVAFVALKIHIHSGGIYEIDTVNGMIFRITFTLIAVITSFFIINKQPKK